MLNQFFYIYLHVTDPLLQELALPGPTPTLDGAGILFWTFGSGLSAASCSGKKEIKLKE